MSSEPSDANAHEGPVRRIPGDAETPQLRDEVALCLSGGGYRAMLYHVGSLWRLNQLGLLSRLSRISSVSGGSITAGVLGLAWKNLKFTNGMAEDFSTAVVTPIRRLAQHTIDLKAGIEILNPFKTIADDIAKSYRDNLFGGATLQDLPDAPRFVFNATNVQSKVLWRFSKPYAWDYRVGKITAPGIQLAVAVGASSAFPPFLSPVVLNFKATDFEAGTDLDLQKEPYTTEVVLTDGGVYDNLGLETVWKQFRTVLVSDGGGVAADEPAPHLDWGRHAFRILEIIDNQVRSLRKRQLIDAFCSGRQGTYWGIRTDISKYGVPTLSCSPQLVAALASTPTRLAALDDETQEHLINWGYAVTDAALRAHCKELLPKAAPEAAFPYSRAVGTV